MASFLLSIDQGTSSSRCIVFKVEDHHISIASCAQYEHQQYYPSAGYVEHDPEEIWDNVRRCIQESVEKLPVGSRIACIGITNQRETTIMWNRKSGRPYFNAIVWNDTRTAEICKKYSYLTPKLQERTGLPMATYFSVTKIMYLLDNVSGLREDAEKGEVCFGTVDSWLLWKLTGGRIHATDVSNASRTMLMNIHTLSWDVELLQIFDIPASILPVIASSSTPTAYSHVTPYSWDSIALTSVMNVPITGILGDQQAALFGQMCYDVGDAKCTYGTGAFLLMNTGTSCPLSQAGLLTTVAYRLESVHSLSQGQTIYALEGSIAYSGSLIQWLRDNLQVLSTISESEVLARSVTDSAGVVFIPAFSGLFAPHWKDDARGVICGLTAFHTKAHIVRAALEAPAFQVWEVIEAMKKDAGSHVNRLQVDGGMTNNGLVMQFQSDLLGVELLTPSIIETTALGAALAAGYALGIWQSLDEIKSYRVSGQQWRPSISEDKRIELVGRWQAGLSRSMNWFHDVEVAQNLQEKLSWKSTHGHSSSKKDSKASSTWTTSTLAISATSLLAGISLGALIALFLSRR